MRQQDTKSRQTENPRVPGPQHQAVMVLPLTQLRLDGGAQPRAEMVAGAVDEYAEAMAAGAEFPPIDVFHDGTRYWAADGFHRIAAKHKLKAQDIACQVHQGTQQDAQWYSYGANQKHGMRRTRGDVERAIRAALEHERAAACTDKQLAEHIGCSQRWVQEIRSKHLTHSAQDTPKRTVTRGGKTYSMDTSGIGRAGATRSIRVASPVSPSSGAVPPAPPSEPLSEGGNGHDPAHLARCLDGVLSAVRRINAQTVLAEDLRPLIAEREDAMMVRAEIQAACEFLARAGVTE